jgi:exopolysaccharide biosynthesis polyprenyl glycosylphosphotransferase
MPGALLQSQKGVGYVDIRPDLINPTSPAAWPPVTTVSGEESGPLPRPRPAASTRAAAPAWQQRYSALVAGCDLFVIAVTVAAGVVYGWGRSPDADRARLVSGLIAGVLLAGALLLGRAWEGRVLGTGPTELLRLGRAVAVAATLLALGGLAAMVESVRVWVFVFIPAAGLLCLLSRVVLRKGLHRRRRAGGCTVSVLAVGSEDAVADLVDRTRRDPVFGWRVSAACTPTGAGRAGGTHIAGVPVVGDLDSVAAVASARADRVVAVCRAPGWGRSRLHRLAWELEQTDAELAVDPGLMEIAGPRMHITPVDGLPLLRLSRPRFVGTARLMKNTVDRCAAALLLLVTAPVFLAVIVAVRLDDRGPAFYSQQRIGVNGGRFRMFKFRSMSQDADERRRDLSAMDAGSGPLFKVHLDPRVTRVGRVLRAYSIDELPQLFNVLNGTMSLVGPRPPLPGEVECYAEDARRRLLVRPGMTGLWQVSGRSDLSWDESVRLDLRYVENWSLALDLSILWKTFAAVVRRDGAY